MQVQSDIRKTPVRFVRGIGPVRAELFKKIGVEAVSDLFYYLPRRHEDRTNLVKIKDLVRGVDSVVTGHVVRSRVFTAFTGTRILEIAVEDETGRVRGTWFNMPYLEKVLDAGKRVVLFGRPEDQKGLVFIHPAFEALGAEDDREILEAGRIVPVYPLVKGLSQRHMRRTVKNALDSHLAGMADFLPTHIRARRKLFDLRFALKNIHFPTSFENLGRAYKRLVFEEFFILQIVMALRRAKEKESGVAHRVKEDLIGDLEKLFDFKLTAGQKKCISEIGKDMASKRPMNRLLQGDVGSGKTVIAAYAMLVAAADGHQSVIMAPTEILARQHYVTISQTLMPLGLDVRLITGSLDPVARNEAREKIKSGEADVVVGTHAVFQEGIEYKKLGLLVVDEQHKFGVSQRDTLLERNPGVDTLVMTATPIPRSLALTLYGDMDISLLAEKPLSRGIVWTYLADEAKRKAVYAFLREKVMEGRQGFVICPRVSEKTKGSLISAEGMYARLRDEVFPDLKVALIHGRMDSDGKDAVMRDFRRGKCDILVATTVVEVGVDIPNAAFMLVEGAERFGLAQLHQMRGRIGRSGHDAYCILMASPADEDSRERLSVFAGTTDGFALAEKDLDLRGPGEFFGTRQSGLAELRFGDPAKDFAIMEEARKEAFDLVANDPELLEERNRGIREMAVERFRGKVEL